jgi:hypothetical protein
VDLDEIAALKRQIAQLQAQLDMQASVTGAGAIAQGGGDALGQSAVKVDGANSGNINTGTQIHGSVQTQGGDFIGRDFIQHLTQIGEDPEIARSVIAHYLSALITDLAGTGSV